MFSLLRFSAKRTVTPLVGTRATRQHLVWEETMCKLGYPPHKRTAYNGQPQPQSEIDAMKAAHAAAAAVR